MVSRGARDLQLHLQPERRGGSHIRVGLLSRSQHHGQSSLSTYHDLNQVKNWFYDESVGRRMWGLTYISLVAKTNQDIFSISHISGSISPPWPVWFMFYQLSIKFITRLRVTTSRPSPRVGWSWGQPPCRPRGCTPALSPAETYPSLRTATPRRSWSPVSSLIWQTVSSKDWYIMIHQYFLRWNIFPVSVPPTSRPTISGALTGYSPGDFVNLNCSTFNVRPSLHPSVIWI